MKKVAVVYWSGTGNTEAMANAVADGAREAGAEVALFTAGDFPLADAPSYDALAFGCPAMGAEELEDGEFLPMWQAVQSSLTGKRIALFGSYGWGDGEWMRNWEGECASLCTSFASDSVICNDAPDDGVLGDCKALGASLL